MWFVRDYIEDATPENIIDDVTRLAGEVLPSLAAEAVINLARTTWINLRLAFSRNDPSPRAVFRNYVNLDSTNKYVRAWQISMMTVIAALSDKYAEGHTLKLGSKEFQDVHEIVMRGLNEATSVVNEAMHEFSLIPEKVKRTQARIREAVEIPPPGGGQISLKRHPVFQIASDFFGRPNEWNMIAADDQNLRQQEEEFLQKLASYKKPRFDSLLLASGSRPGAIPSRKRRRGMDYFNPPDPWAWLKRLQGLHDIASKVQHPKGLDLVHMGKWFALHRVTYQSTALVVPNATGTEPWKWLFTDVFSVTKGNHEDDRVGTKVICKGIETRILHRNNNASYTGVVRTMLLYFPGRTGNNPPDTSIFDPDCVTNASTTTMSPTFGTSSEQGMLVLWDVMHDLSRWGEYPNAAHIRTFQEVELPTIFQDITNYAVTGSYYLVFGLQGFGGSMSTCIHQVALSFYFDSAARQDLAGWGMTGSTALKPFKSKLPPPLPITPAPKPTTWKASKLHHDWKDKYGYRYHIPQRSWDAWNKTWKEQYNVLKYEFTYEQWIEWNMFHDNPRPTNQP